MSTDDTTTPAALYDEHRDYVVGTLIRYFLNPRRNEREELWKDQRGSTDSDFFLEELADELASAVFHDVIEKHDPNQSSFPTFWVNSARNALRTMERQARARRKRLRVLDDRLAAPDQRPQPDDHVVQQERDDAVRAALAQLSDADAAFAQHIASFDAHNRVKAAAEHDGASYKAYARRWRKIRTQLQRIMDGDPIFDF